MKFSILAIALTAIVSISAAPGEAACKRGACPKSTSAPLPSPTKVVDSYSPPKPKPCTSVAPKPTVVPTYEQPSYGKPSYGKPSYEGPTYVEPKPTKKTVCKPKCEEKCEKPKCDEQKCEKPKCEKKCEQACETETCDKDGKNCETKTGIFLIFKKRL